MVDISHPQPSENNSLRSDGPGRSTETARNPQSGDAQKDWNSGHPGGVAMSEASQNTPRQTSVEKPKRKIETSIALLVVLVVMTLLVLLWLYVKDHYHAL